MSNQGEQSVSRRVLVVSYYFPPSGGPGVQRVLKFVRYLPGLGYIPHVLTVPESAEFPVRDPSLLQEIPEEARIHRARIREFYSLYRFLSRTPQQEKVQLATSARRARGPVRRLLQSARAAFMIPDGRMGWYPGGVSAGREICRREPVELILASGPPFTAHWIAKRLSEETGLPLVLDFRDPWIGAPFYPRRPGPARRLDEKLEAACLNQARQVLTVNQEIRDDLMRRYPHLPPERFVVLPNGYDPADFQEPVGPAEKDWTLVHTGTLPVSRFPEGLVPALESMLREQPSLAGSMKVRLAGHVDPVLRPRLFRPQLQPVLREEGYLPHAESVRLLRRSHLLLLLIEDGPRAKGILTGKLFEYLASGTPILALAPEGEAADLIRRTRSGRVVPGDDVRAVTAALKEAREAFLQGRRPFGEPDRAAVEEFSRDRLTGRLARVFDEILNRG